MQLALCLLVIIPLVYSAAIQEEKRNFFLPDDFNLSRKFLKKISINTYMTISVIEQMLYSLRLLFEASVGSKTV